MNWIEENIKEEFRLINKNKTRNCFIEEMICKKHKRFCRFLSYTGHYFSLQASKTAGVVSISAFTSLLDIPAGIVSFANRIKICSITAVIKKYKSMIKKEKKKDNKMVLLSNTAGVLTFKALIDWCINLDAFVQINKVLKTCDKMKEKIKNPNNEMKWIFIV